MAETNRPANLRYAFNDKPDLVTLIILAFQQLIPMSVSLVFVVTLLQTIQVAPLEAASVISICMLAIAIATFLQAQRWKWLGSGTFLPLSATPNILAQSMIAIKMGGLPLLFGMTLFASFVQAILTPFVDIIRKYFPAEIAALVLALIGIDLSMMGLKQFIVYYRIAEQIFSNSLFTFHIISFLPMVLIIIFGIWGNALLRIYNLMLSAVIGYLLIYFLGYMEPTAIQTILSSQWLFLPQIAPGGYHFSSLLIIPFLIGALVNTVKICGSVAGLQEMQAVNFVNPDMKQIARANFADSIGTFIAGLLGSMGTNASSSGISISLSTGVTSRYIAYPFVLIVFSLAFCPKISLILIYMPKPITSAVLFYLGAALLISGLKMMLRHITTFKQQLCIGISFAFGLSYDVYPQIYTQLPESVQSLTGSTFVIAALCAVVLNFFFSLKKPHTIRG